MKDFIKTFFNRCKNLFFRIKDKVKAFLLVLGRFILLHRKILLKSTAVFLGLFCISWMIYLYTSNVFYYRHNFKNKILSDRRCVKAVAPESKLQAYVRTYFSGGLRYDMALPYNGRENLLGIYHDAKKKTLILDWGAGFTLNWQDGLLKKDTELFFYSLKENFRIESVRFLIEGRPAGLSWEEFSLDDGVPLDKLQFTVKK